MRLEFYRDLDHISSQHRWELEYLLWVKIWSFDFDNHKSKKIIAHLFQSKLKVLQQDSFYELQTSFNAMMDDKLEQWIKQWLIIRLRNRKEHTRRDKMAVLAKLRDSFAHKMQLSNSRSEDFIISISSTHIDLLPYIKPDFGQQYRQDIAHQCTPWYSKHHLVRRLYENYHDLVLPMLQWAELLHEASDGEQQQTSRIIRIPYLEDNNATFGRLLSQHTPQETKVKRHTYQVDRLRIQFYPNKEWVINEFTKQQSYLPKQVERFTQILESLPKTATDCKDLYRNFRSEFDMIIASAKNIVQEWKTSADDAIRYSVIPDNNSFLTWKMISSMRRKIGEQIYKANMIMEKNKLHIESLEKYNIS